MIKVYSREDVINNRVPLTAILVRLSKNSDHAYYKVFSNEEYRRIAKYYGLEEFLDD